MRACELTENNNPPSKPITLRALHKWKNKNKSNARIEQARFDFMPIMYGNLDRQRELLELERLRLEMDELRAEILATNTETANKSAMAIQKNAKSGIKSKQQTQQHLTK